MSTEYRHNHYVPEWYQKRFIPADQVNRELYLLNLAPGTFLDSRGVSHPRKALRRLGFKHCFAETDLYTTYFGSAESTEIEKQFFGEIDNNGRRAVSYFADFAHPSVSGTAFKNLMLYMSTQKLRTPKGLGWLGTQARTADRQEALRLMLELRRVHCAIWAECVWLIADASQSDTKFIVSDHPVTVYNRRCGPRSDWCRGYNDPDIHLQATHTIFPLSLDRILLLSNLSWVRNPYQSETKPRPNSNPFRSALFNFSDIQTLRHLNEQEVREINFIIKSRALRYVAAAKAEWLHPEGYVSKSNWATLGNGYLLMPDPRALHLGGEVIIGFNNGSSTMYDEYGRRPWEERYGEEGRNLSEAASLDRFQGEFARLYGPDRRGRSFETMRLDNERDDEEFHRHHLSLEGKRRR
jgi:Protein of unknown function (DUF4238)